MLSSSYDDSVKSYHVNYTRNARAVAILWALLTICFLIINVVVFAQPQWIGDTQESVGAGHFGLYEYCIRRGDRSSVICFGRFGSMTDIIHPAFKAATVFTGLSVLLCLFCLVCMCLFCCVRDSKVFVLCGFLQVICSLCMLLSIVIYPAGFSHSEVQAVCGNKAHAYHLDQCGIRWAYILAIIGFFDALILSVLAFVLAFFQAELSLPKKPPPKIISTERVWVDDSGGTLSRSMTGSSVFAQSPPPTAAVFANGARFNPNGPSAGSTLPQKSGLGGGGGGAHQHHSSLVVLPSRHEVVQSSEGDYQMSSLQRPRGLPSSSAAHVRVRSIDGAAATTGRRNNKY